MDFRKLIVTLSLPRWQLDRMIAVDTRKSELKALTDFNNAWIEKLVTRIEAAASTTTMSNWAFATECMERIKAMAARGDTQDQIDEWAANLPDELLKTLYAEALGLQHLGIYQAGYPGGPGALFPKQG
jgi:hypothetical protein